MTREDLIKLKEKLANLSEEDQKQRDLYLRELALGELQGPPTGYPSIDKPWLKYYREKPIKEINTNQTIYEMVFSNNMDADAIGYLGTTLTYKELKEKVDRCADALSKNNIGLGDVVLIGVSNCPESMIMLLALDKLGAASKWFDVRASEKEIINYANNDRCKIVVAFDMLLPKLENICNNTSVEKVVMLSPVNSLSKPKQLLFKAHQRIKGENVSKPKSSSFIDFADFMKMGDKDSKIECVKFDKNRPAIMVQSSGTTGKPKTVVHSDYSATTSVKSLAYSDLPLGEGKIALVALPPWIAYGLSNAMIMPLALGTKIELSPNFDKDVLTKYIGKFTISFAAPFHYRYLKDNFNNLTAMEKNAFMITECLVSGGDKISPEENAEFEKTFGCVLVNGYGNNEGWGALTVNPTRANRYGSVGIPLRDATILAYDDNQKKELQYDELGELCSLSNTIFLYYKDMPEKTEQVKKPLEISGYGNHTLHTGDLGYIDKDGFIFLGGRIDRVIVRLGFKISAYTIEDKVTELPEIKECIAVSVKDDEEEHVPMIFITTKEGITLSDEEIKRIINDKCFSELKEYEVPKHIMVVKSLPYTSNNKYDFRALEDKGNQYVDSLVAKTRKLVMHK